MPANGSTGVRTGIPLHIGPIAPIFKPYFTIRQSLGTAQQLSPTRGVLDSGRFESRCNWFGGVLRPHALAGLMPIQL